MEGQPHDRRGGGCKSIIFHLQVFNAVRVLPTFNNVHAIKNFTTAGRSHIHVTRPRATFCPWPPFWEHLDCRLIMAGKIFVISCRCRSWKTRVGLMWRWTRKKFNEPERNLRTTTTNWSYTAILIVFIHSKSSFKYLQNARSFRVDYGVCWDR